MSLRLGRSVSCEHGALEPGFFDRQILGDRATFEPQCPKTLESPNLPDDVMIKLAEFVPDFINPPLVSTEVEERVDEPNLLFFTLSKSHDLVLTEEVA